MLVFELVVTATDTAKRGESQVFSGGYGTLEHGKIFGIGKNQRIDVLSLHKGSPRDLLALVEGGRGASDATISIIMTEDYY